MSFDINYDIPTIITKRNVDSMENPIGVKLLEKKQVMDNHSCIVLSQIPDENYRITIEGFNEVFNSDELGNNNFYVSYSQGVIYFLPRYNGKTVVVEYYGIGYELISASRVFYKHDKHGGIIETLEEILDNAKEQLELIKTLGDSVKVIEKLEMDLENGKVLHDNLENDIEVGAPLQENLHADIVEAKKWKDQLHQDVTDGKVLQPLLQQTVEDAEDVKVRLDKSIADAQEDIATIEATGNKEIIIQSSQWRLNGDVYEKEITHDLNSENLHVTAKNSNTKEAVTIGYKIVDKTRILLKSDEAINMSVILSASYYHATQTISDNIAEEVVKARKGETGLDVKIAKIDEQLDNKANQVDLKTLENRMDSFVTLPGQSVSSVGDAELVDGRVGADGVTYPNIGNSIREQMNKKQNAIFEYVDMAITLENGLYNNITTVVNTAKTEYKYTKITIEKGVDYKISCRGANGEYSSIIGIDSVGGRHIILTGTNVYTKDYVLTSSNIEKYVSLVINTADTTTSPIVVKRSQKVDITDYIVEKFEELSNKKTMLCNLNGNSCKIRFKYSKTKDCIIIFTDYVNNCFKLSHIYLIDNVSNQIVWDFTGRDSTTQYTFINSEWISPYKNLNAVNNPITSVTNQWTGGSHAIGTVKTNNIKSVKAYCDGVEIGQNIDTKCKEIKLVCTTEVSGSNTTATTFENNRYVLREIQEWTITPNTFDVNVKFEFLEDCTLGINYGLQTENTGFTKLRHYGDSSNLGLVNMKAYAYGSNKTVGIANGWCLKDNNGNTLEVLVDTTYKCGNRCLIKTDTPTIVTASYGKTYSYIVSEASFKAGDIVEHRGKYKFYYSN